MVEIIQHEIDSLIDKPEKEFLPEGLRKSTERILENTKDITEKEKIEKSVKSNLIKYKANEINKVIDQLEEFIKPEEIANIRNEVNKRLLKARKG